MVVSGHVAEVTVMVFVMGLFGVMMVEMMMQVVFLSETYHGMLS